MPDFLPVVELAAKAVRGALAYIGAAIDCGIPGQYSQSSPAAGAAAETGPEAVSARAESAAPASGLPIASAGPPAAGDDPAGTPPPAGSPLTWMGWASPAICDVLGDHVPYPMVAGRGVIVCHHADASVCGEFADWQDWREHVGPHLADRTDPWQHYRQRALQGDALQDMAEADEQVVTRLDSWETEVGFASEMFPQHQKYPK